MTRSMKWLEAARRWWKPLAGIAVLVFLMAWSAGALRSKVAPGTVDAPPGIPVPDGAAVIDVRSAPAVTVVEVPGTVVPARKVAVSPVVGAYVRDVKVRSGAAVRAGDELVLLDDRDAAQQVAQAEGQLAQAGAELARVQRLFDKSAGTPQSLEAATAVWTAAKAQAERARVLLGFTRLTAPMDGVVSERRVEPGDFAAPGMPLLTLYDPTSPRLEVAVPERLAGQAQQGFGLEILLDNQAGVITGTVAEVVAEVDPASRTRRVKVDLGRGSEGVLPGASGRVRLPGEARRSIRIPGGAVWRAGQLEMVHVVRDGRAVRRLVRTVPASGGMVEVTAGLTDGDRILTTPARER